MKKEKRTTTLIVMVDDKKAAQRIADFAERHGSIVAQIRKGKMKKVA